MGKLYRDAPALSVHTAPTGEPNAVCWRDDWYEGVSLNHWRIATDWWEEKASDRDYYLFDGDDLLCEVYKEGDSWHLHRIYD